MISIRRTQTSFTIEISQSALPIVICIGLILAIIILAGFACAARGDIFTLGLFIATSALAYIAYVQLKALNEQAKSTNDQTQANFLLTLNREFFDNESIKQIIIAIEEKQPILPNDELKLYKIDDFLGYYELMAGLEKKGLLSFETIDDMFGHYISLAWQNAEIQEYIDSLRKETHDPRYYQPFELLASRLIEKENEIRTQAGASDHN